MRIYHLARAAQKIEVFCTKIGKKWPKSGQKVLKYFWFSQNFLATYPPTYVSRRRWAFLPTYLEGIATYLSIWGGTTTYLPILEQSSYLSTYLLIQEEMSTHLPGQEDEVTYLPFLESSIYLSTPNYLSTRRGSSTYLSIRRWPPPPTCLGGDGHLNLGADSYPYPPHLLGRR